MKSEEALGWLLSLLFSYAFLWALLNYIKTPGVDLKMAAAVLLVLGAVAKASNPLVWKLYGGRPGAARAKKRRR